MRPFNFVALLFIIWLAAAATCCAAETSQAAPGTSQTPVSKLLRSDGSMDLSTGFSGSLDVKGYQMVTGTDGTPRFVPSCAAGATSGPESDPDDVYWDDQFGFTGTDGLVLATVTDASGNLYIGGAFSAVGNIPAHNVAKWNGRSWSPLGSGTGGANGSTVYALAVCGSDVYAGGRFTTAGGVSASGIAKWDGRSWSSLGSGVGGMCPWVEALAVSTSDVYAGGPFMIAGGVSANCIAKWDGRSWSSLGSGVGGTNLSVHALAVSGNDLYAGGPFTIAGDVSARGIAKWDGRSWSSLGSGMDGTYFDVRALAVSGSDVYAGGNFPTAGGIPAAHIAKWDGTSWSPLGSGMGGRDSYVRTLAVSGSDVYAGGDFTTAGGVKAGGIAKWDGMSWSSLGSELSSEVYALVVSGSDVCAGGSFTIDGGVSAKGMAKWDGTSWSMPGRGMGGALDSSISALALSGSDLYAGGYLRTDGGLPAAVRIVRWDGHSWSQLGTGLSLSPPIDVYCVDSDTSVAALAVSQGCVFAAIESKFRYPCGHTYGDVWRCCVFRWDGTSWASRGEMDGRVHALAASGSDVYAGGTFKTAGGVSANGAARWDGASWSPLGSGVSETSYRFATFAVSGGDVYAGGRFTTADGVSTNGVARWDGVSWLTVGETNGAVDALAVSGNDVYAGGEFTTAGGVSANGIAKWDGTSWSPLGSGVGETFYRVTTLAVSGNDVYAGGDFTTIGGVSANRIAKWDGTSWSSLGSGMDGTVNALAVRGNTLMLGGDFTAAGGKASGHFAAFQPRVDVSSATVSTNPGELTVGDSPCGFNRPALMTKAGTTVDYAGGLPTTVTLDRADEIQVGGNRVNGAFTLSPGQMQFGGDGATIRVEFSDVDVALFGRPYTDFRVVSLTYPCGYPTSKEAAGMSTLPGQSAPVPIRIDNGKQIYAITAPLTSIGGTYGAVPTAANLALAGSCDAESILVGQSLSTILTVTNDGPITATGVIVSDRIPDGCTYVSSSASQGTVLKENGAVVAELGIIPVGDSATVSVVLQPVTQGTFTNTGVVAAEQDDPVPGDNIVTVTASVLPFPRPDLVVSGSCDPSAVLVGGEVTCVFSVANSGPGQATGVALAGTLPVGCAYVSSACSQGSVLVERGVLTSQLGSLAPGSSATVTSVLRPEVVGTLDFAVSVLSDQADLRSDDNGVTVVTSVTLGPGPDLVGNWSAVSQSTRTTRAGSMCTVKGRLTVSNAGNQDAGRSIVRIYLSDTASVSPGSTPIRTINVQRLRAARSSTQLLRIRLPAGAQASGKSLVAVLDAEGAVAESNEFNNVAISGSL